MFIYTEFTDQTSLKADEEDWGWGKGSKIESTVVLTIELPIELAIEVTIE